MSLPEAILKEVKQDGLNNIYRMLYNISYSLYKLDDMPKAKVWRKISRSKNKAPHPAIVIGQYFITSFLFKETLTN